MNLCSFCLKAENEAIKHKSCSACLQRQYCSVECQKKDWRRGHKGECVQLKISAAAWKAFITASKAVCQRFLFNFGNRVTLMRFLRPIEGIHMQGLSKWFYTGALGLAMPVVKGFGTCPLFLTKEGTILGFNPRLKTHQLRTFSPLGSSLEDFGFNSSYCRISHSRLFCVANDPRMLCTVLTAYFNTLSFTGEPCAAANRNVFVPGLLHEPSLNLILMIGGGILNEADAIEATDLVSVYSLERNTWRILPQKMIRKRWDLGVCIQKDYIYTILGD